MMNMLSKMLTSKVSIKRQDGSTYEDIPAHVDSRRGEVILAETNITIADGDTLIYHRANGLPVEFVITDAEFVQSTSPGPFPSAFPESYLLTVKKKSPVIGAHGQGNVIYNIYGMQSRVNINSQDHSVNIVQKDAAGIFEDLKNVILSGVPDEEADVLLKTVQDMENSQGQKGFLQAYQDFMQLAANHITVVAPFLPALAQLLSSLQ